MASSPVVAAHGHLTEAVDELSAACAPTATADDLLSVLTIGEGGGAAAGSDRRSRGGRLVAARNVRRAGISQRGHGRRGPHGLGSRRGAAPGKRSGAGMSPHRSGWSRLARAVARDGAAVRHGSSEFAARRGDHASAGWPVRAAVGAHGVVKRRGRAGGPRRPVHALGVVGMGLPTGRHAGPGRTRARRPPAGSGQRGAPAALPWPSRWHTEGAFRRRRDVRRDRRGGRRAGPSHRLRGPTHASATAGRSARRRVRVRARPRRRAFLWRTAPTPERARAAGGSGEPGPRRRVWISAAR